MEFNSYNKGNSKVYQGVSLIFEHFKEREAKLVHALYNHISVEEVAQVLGVTKKFLYTNYGAINTERSELLKRVRKEKRGK
jgi:hypothetical protein